MSGSENSEFGIGSSDYSRTKNTNNTYNYGSNSIGNNNNNNNYDDDLGGYQPSVGGMKNKPRVVVNQNPYTINNPILSQNKISYQPSILENNGL